MPILRNPILPGFNPDPSILRVGDDYYIATSTFEWYPGVQIHHSTRSRELGPRHPAADPQAQLDMRGDPDSAAASGRRASPMTARSSGSSIPTSSARTARSRTRTTTSSPRTRSKARGRDPVYVNSSGFDPSLFHDDDGRKWFVNMLWDHRVRPLLFDGIALQEYDPKAGKLVGERKNIFQGTDLKLVEGPHLYKRNGWYYLLTAEGGTGYEHACDLRALAQDRRALRAPSREVHRHRQGRAVQRGAALRPRRHRRDARRQDLLRPPDGPPDDAVPALRPRPRDRHPGSRVARRRLALAQGRPRPVARGRRARHARRQRHTGPSSATTSTARCHKDFQWLRTPEPDRIFESSGGKLRLFGRESIGSWFEQALVARRSTHFSFDAETTLDFSPTDERQFAGPHRTTTAATISTISRSPPIPTASASC